MSSSSSMIGSSRGALQLFHSQPQELIERKYQLIREHKNEIRSIALSRQIIRTRLYSPENYQQLRSKFLQNRGLPQYDYQRLADRLREILQLGASYSIDVSSEIHVYLEQGSEKKNIGTPLPSYRIAIHSSIEKIGSDCLRTCIDATLGSNGVSEFNPEKEGRAIEEFLFGKNRIRQQVIEDFDKAMTGCDQLIIWISVDGTKYEVETNRDVKFSVASRGALIISEALKVLSTLKNTRNSWNSREDTERTGCCETSWITCLYEGRGVASTFFSSAHPHQRMSPLERTSIAIRSGSLSLAIVDLTFKELGISSIYRSYVKACETFFRSLNFFVGFAHQLADERGTDSSSSARAERVLLNLMSAGQTAAETHYLMGRSFSERGSQESNHPLFEQFSAPRFYADIRRLTDFFNGLFRLRGAVFSGREGHRFFRYSQLGRIGSLNEGIASPRSRSFEAVSRIGLAYMQATGAITTMLLSTPRKLGEIIHCISECGYSGLNFLDISRAPGFSSGVSFSLTKHKEQFGLSIEDIFRTDLPGRTFDGVQKQIYDQIVNETIELMEWRSWNSIPAPFSESEKLYKMVCSLSGRPIRFIIKPANTWGVYYDKMVLKRWVEESPGVTPPNWPEECPLYLEGEPSIQYLIDRSLSEVCNIRLASIANFPSSAPEAPYLKEAFLRKIFMSFMFDQNQRGVDRDRNQMLFKLRHYLYSLQAFLIECPEQLFFKKILWALLEKHEELMQ